MEGEEPKPPPTETEQVKEIKRKIRDAFSVFDREGRNACDVREVGTIVRSLNIYPTEKQLQRWIHEMEEEEPTGFIVYEKVCADRPSCWNCGTAAAVPSQHVVCRTMLACCPSPLPSSSSNWSWPGCSRRKHLNTNATLKMKSSQPSRR